MFFFTKIIAVITAVLFFSTNAQAQFAEKVDGSADNHIRITVTGFLDYPPVGYITEEDRNIVYHTVFKQVMDDLAENAFLDITYKTEGSYNDLVQKTLGGDIDLILGSYHETKLYDGLEFVFPSLINNPVSIIMLPENAGKIKNLSQLKKLKGGVSNKEHLSDYVKDQIETYNVEHFDSSYAMFEKLFTGKIDYIFASQFFGIVESAKLGLRDRLSFSKQVIWNMPLFFGVSKFSRHRKLLTEKLASYSERPESKERLEEYLRKTINEIELQYRGVVPPPYSLESTEENKEDNSAA